MIPASHQITFDMAAGWLTELADDLERAIQTDEAHHLDVAMLRKIAVLLRADPCLIKLQPGEPWFVLRAHDELAPLVVSYWAQLASGGTHHGPEKIAEATDCAVAMAHWYQGQHPEIDW